MDLLAAYFAAKDEFRKGSRDVVFPAGTLLVVSPPTSWFAQLPLGKPTWFRGSRNQAKRIRRDR
jgi:hypothetical protein